MSALLSTFFCCVWWFLLGVLLGWLLNYWLCKCCRKSSITEPQITTKTDTPPVAKNVDMPAPPVASVTPVATAPVTTKPAEPSPTVINIAAAKAAGFAIKSADDLTVIEGIGPKINELFKQAGLKTFADVAKASVPQMRKILDDGGARFRIANPSTWAQQAELAANNKWDALKQLQDELSGGLRK